MTCSFRTFLFRFAGMEQLKDKNKLLVLDKGDLVLFNVSASSRNGFDKFTRLSCDALGFEFIKVYKDPRVAIEDFLIMDDEGANRCFQGVSSERNLRLMESDTGTMMLLPLN